MGALRGKVAIVTGGASGIGEASARLFVAEGAHVAIADVVEERGARLARLLGRRCLFVRADVSQEKDVAGLVGTVVDRFGRLDCMLSNAGMSGSIRPIAEFATVDFDREVAVMLRGVFLGMKYAAPTMKKQGSGSLINMASIAGLRTGSGGHGYSAAKAAVIHLTRSVAMELGESGVRVNAVCPGGIATPIFGKVVKVPEAKEARGVEVMRQVLEKAQPLQRAGLPEDVARAALWLASDASSFVTGHALVVDGGLSGGALWSRFQKGRKKLRARLRRATR